MKRDALMLLDVEILQWAQISGCPWDAGTCASAAKRGDLELLQWARSNGCPWDEETCALVAEYGHFIWR
jgi:hypothetical protein